MIKIALLAAFLGIACAAPSQTYDTGYSDFERGTNIHNGLRQGRVNNIAEYVGSGTGTADYYGVPGTLVRKNGYGTVHNAGYGATNYGVGYGVTGYGRHGAAAGYSAGYAPAVHNVGYVAPNYGVAHGATAYLPRHGATTYTDSYYQ